MRRRFVFHAFLATFLLSNFIPLSYATKPDPSHIYWVVLGGGGGLRLWPLSRTKKPKQFLEVTGENLIQQSIDRLKAYPGFERSHVYLSTGNDLAAMAGQTADEIPEITGLILEPSRRDTGPAILLAAMEIYQQDPEAHIMFLPADPYIPLGHYEAFSSYLEQAMDVLGEQPDKLLLLGKKPTYAATGFGYIEYASSETTVASNSFRIQSFHEKPNAEIAASYLRQDTMLWNMGMFAGKAKTFTDLFQKHAPLMHQGVANFLDKKASFDVVEKRSVDYAIMEPASAAGELLVLPVGGIDWFDVGNVDVFLTIRDQYLHEHGLTSDKKIEHLASGNKVYMENKEKVAVFLGVDGLCVVDSSDALLISKCSEVEKVKQVVEGMQKDKDKYGKYL